MRSSSSSSELLCPFTNNESVLRLVARTHLVQRPKMSSCKRELLLAQGSGASVKHLQTASFLVAAN